MTSTTYTIDHVTGYNADQTPTIETRTVTATELADWLGSDDLAAHLIETGRLGQHDEWAIQA